MLFASAPELYTDNNEIVVMNEQMGTYQLDFRLLEKVLVRFLRQGVVSRGFSLVRYFGDESEPWQEINDTVASICSIDPLGGMVSNEN